jgi:hypothetical protein
MLTLNIFTQVGSSLSHYRSLVLSSPQKALVPTQGTFKLIDCMAYHHASLGLNPTQKAVMLDSGKYPNFIT